jgi:hypothetical protein
MLQVRELTAETDAPWAARLRYAYAEALLTAGRGDEAREWFARAAEVDTDVTTDAAERLLDLDGVVLDESEPDVDELDEAELDEEENESDEDAELDEEKKEEVGDEDRPDAGPLT